MVANRQRIRPIRGREGMRVCVRKIIVGGVSKRASLLELAVGGALPRHLLQTYIQLLLPGMGDLVGQLGSQVSKWELETRLRTVEPRLAQVPPFWIRTATQG